MSKSFQKHIRLHQIHLDILDDVISTRSDISNYAEAIRFLCVTYKEDTHKVETENQIKLNVIGKELSILTEIITEFADIHLKNTGILVGRESTIYNDVKEKVESKIKVNQTQHHSERENRNDKKTTSSVLKSETSEIMNRFKP